MTALEPRLRSPHAVLAGAAHSSPGAVCLGTDVFCYQRTFPIESFNLGTFPLSVQSRSFPGGAQVCSMEQCHWFCSGNGGSTSNLICLALFGPWPLLLRLLRTSDRICIGSKSVVGCAGWSADGHGRHDGCACPAVVLSFCAMMFSHAVSSLQLWILMEKPLFSSEKCPSLASRFPPQHMAFLSAFAFAFHGLL